MTSLCSVILIVFAVGDHTAAAFGVMRHKLLYPNIRGRGGNEVIGGIGNDYYAGSQQLHLHHVSKDRQREGSRKRRINITFQSFTTATSTELHAAASADGNDSTNNQDQESSNDDTNNNTSSATTSSSSTSSSATTTSQQPKEYQLIESWLTTHLPTLPLADLQSYTSHLYNDGFTTLDNLNSINTPGGGGQVGNKLEDLYFMKKGHRRVLMKKIGIMRTVRGMEGNRLGSTSLFSKGDNHSSSASVSNNNSMAGRNNNIRGGITKSSIDSLVEKRRLDRLAEEEQYRTEHAAAFATSSPLPISTKVTLSPSNTTPPQSDEPLSLDESETSQAASSQVSSSSANAKQQNQQAADEAEEREDAVITDDFASRYQSLERLPTDDHGTADKETRRLEEMRRDFLNRAQAKYEQQYDEEDSLIDDLAARYQSLDDIGHQANDGGKEAQRLEGIKKNFSNKARRKDYDAAEEDFVADDLSARYQSLDIDAMGYGSKDKETRRLDEIKSAFKNRRPSAIDGWDAAEEDFAADDMAARYQSLDIEAMDDGTRDKESRRLQAFRKKKATTNKRREDEYYNAAYPTPSSDDFAARYSSLDIEAMGDGTEGKASRRLEELKRTFPSNKNAMLNEEDDEPLRLDLLERHTQDETAIDRKEHMRVVEFQRLSRLSAEKTKVRRLQQQLKRLQREEQEGQHGGESVGNEKSDHGGSENNSSQSKVTYKTNEERRMDDLSQYFDKRREARMVAEEERRLEGEQLLTAKKLKEAQLMKDNTDEDEVLEGVSDSGRDDDENNVVLDNFFNKRSTDSSLSTTMQPKGKGKEDDFSITSPAEKREAMITEMNLDAYQDITVNNMRERENLSLATTMPPSNRGARTVRRPSKESEDPDEECILVGDEEECRDITRQPNFYSRETRSLATTLPPLNANERAPSMAGAANRGGRTDRRPFKNNNAEGGKNEKVEEDTDEECNLVGDEEECRDITRQPNFYSRETRSLATTLPPLNANERAPSMAGAATTKTSMDGNRPKGTNNNRATGEADDAPFYNVQNSFSESRGRIFPSQATASSAIRGKAPESNDTPIKKEVLVEPPLPLTDGLTAEEAEEVRNARLTGESKPASMPKGMSQDQEVTEGQMAEQAQESRNARLNAADEAAKTLKVPPTTESASMVVPEEESAVGPAKNETPNSSMKTKMNTGASDLYQRFRQSSSDEGERSLPPPRMMVSPHANLPKWSHKPRQDSTTTTSISEDSLFLDITSRFPDNRPSESGVKKRSTAARDDGRKRPTADDSYHDISNFPNERPSDHVNTGTRKERTTQRSNAERAGLKEQPGITNEKDQPGITNIAQNFSQDRSSLLGHVPRHEIRTSQSKSNDSPDRPRFSSGKLGPPPPSSTVTSAFREAADGQNFLDKPRPFQSNVDMTSSNMSGVRFKRSRDKVPVSTLERNASKANPTGDGSIGSNPVQSSDSSDQLDEPSHEDVMSWILTHLPQVQEEDAVSYFNCLVEDGFDSTDSLGEVVAEDLYFMKKQHQRALLRSIRELTEHNNAQADDQIIPSETLADTIDRTKAQLEEIEAWIDEQNQLVEESLASRLAKEESAKNELD